MRADTYVFLHAKCSLPLSVFNEEGIFQQVTVLLLGIKLTRNPFHGSMLITQGR